MNSGHQEREGSVDFTRYRVLVAGEFGARMRQWAGLTELGPRVTVVGMAAPARREKILALALEDALFLDGPETLAAEVYARWPSSDLVVLVGPPAPEIEQVLRPWMEEAAAASMNPLLPLVRVDDPGLRFLRTGEQWAFFLLGRTLGLEPRRAREFMEECCGYQKENS